LYRRPRGAAGKDYGVGKPVHEPSTTTAMGEPTHMVFEGATVPVAVAPVAVGNPTHMDVEGVSTSGGAAPVQPSMMVEEEDEPMPDAKYPAPVSVPVRAVA
jgi:hypothetical protein